MTGEVTVVHYRGSFRVCSTPHGAQTVARSSAVVPALSDETAAARAKVRDAYKIRTNKNQRSLHCKVNKNVQYKSTVLLNS